MNHAVAATHHWQALAHKPLTKYHWGAHHTTTTTAARWRIAARWWDRAWSAHAAAMRWLKAHPYGYVPSWFVSAVRCIAENEEYGFPDEGGYNTSAGYFGMISAPSAYPGSSGAVATYGDSWLAIPFAAQLPIVYAEYLKYGWSPWSTAPGCGLA